MAKIKDSKETAGSCIVDCNEIAYVSKTDTRGWLLVSPNSGGGGNLFALPKYLKVKITSRKNARVQFVILEGRLKGKSASVTEKGGPYLNNTNLQTKEAKLTLNLTKKNLTYDGKEIDAFTQEFEEKYSGAPLDPLPVGKWKIEIPDAPHKVGEGYEEFSPYAVTWFPIQTSVTLDRYIHVGSLSHGCATIGINRVPIEIKGKLFDYNANRKSFEAWTNLYQYLIKSRLDDKFVGTIEVIK